MSDKVDKKVLKEKLNSIVLKRRLKEPSVTKAKKPKVEEKKTQQRKKKDKGDESR